MAMKEYFYIITGQCNYSNVEHTFSISGIFTDKQDRTKEQIYTTICRKLEKNIHPLKKKPMQYFSIIFQRTKTNLPRLAHRAQREFFYLFFLSLRARTRAQQSHTFTGLPRRRVRLLAMTEEGNVVELLNFFYFETHQ